MLRTNSSKPTVRVKLLPSIAFILVLALLLKLGFWQLERANTKAKLATVYQQSNLKTPLNISSLPKDVEQALYRRVKLRGHFDNVHQLLLDNRVYQHHVGYEVLTPFQAQGNKLILINRGFIKAPDKRSLLPNIKPVDQVVTLEGRIVLPTKNPFLFVRDTKPQHWPWRIQAINTVQISTVLGKEIYPFVVQLSPKSPHGFQRQWKPITTTANKHLGYAIQWFSLALTLVIIYLVVNIRRGRHEQQSRND